MLDPDSYFSTQDRESRTLRRPGRLRATVQVLRGGTLLYRLPVRYAASRSDVDRTNGGEVRKTQTRMSNVSDKRR